MRDTVNLNELYPLIKEVIEKGGEFRLFPRGISMEPMIHAGDDSVVLSKIDGISEGDILFYKRDDGTFVLHRLIEKRGGTLTMCGDNQMKLEYGVREDQLLAKMVSYYKGDVLHTLDTPEYLEYKKKMLSRFRFYRRNPFIYKILKKVKHLFKKS